MKHLIKTKKHTKLWQWQLKCKDGTQKCAKCGLDKGLSVDHIVPVSLVVQFIVESDYDVAYEDEENFEILCNYCNRMKGDRIDPRNPKVYKVLERVIELGKKIHLEI